MCFNWDSPTLVERMVQALCLQLSMWKYGLMVRASCVHKSLRLKIG